MHYDVKISGDRIRTHDLLIRKHVCYTHYTTAPHITSSDHQRHKRNAGLRTASQVQAEPKFLTVAHQTPILRPIDTKLTNLAKLITR